MAPRPSFEQVAHEHGPMIRRIASSYEADIHLAEELVQDILYAIWRTLPSYRGASSVRAFVARIATNRAVTHVARAMRIPKRADLSENLASTADGPETQAIVHEQAARLLSAVRSLPLALRQAALLRLEGFSTKEIAGILGISANAVAIRTSRSKEILRQLLGEPR